MIVVCEVCKRILVDGKWVHGVPPIQKMKYTTCPHCQSSSKSNENDPSKGMVYQEYLRKQDDEVKRKK